jgi:hypothetical protein
VMSGAGAVMDGWLDARLGIGGADSLCIAHARLSEPRRAMCSLCRGLIPRRHQRRRPLTGVSSSPALSLAAAVKHLGCGHRRGLVFEYGKSLSFLVHRRILTVFFWCDYQASAPPRATRYLSS